MESRIDEALTILMEECGEVIQCASKIIRFGDAEDKRIELSRELGQIEYMINLLIELDTVIPSEKSDGYTEKGVKLRKYSNLFLNPEAPEKHSEYYWDKNRNR